jgi:hypothetical protein
MTMISIQDRRIGHERRIVPVPSGILWSCDFTAPLPSYGFIEQAKVPRAVMVMAGGRTAVRLQPPRTGVIGIAL